MFPRLACFDVTRIQNPPPGFDYISKRLDEPLVKELIKQDPSKLKSEYVRKGWMRDHI